MVDGWVKVGGWAVGDKLWLKLNSAQLGLSLATKRGSEMDTFIIMLAQLKAEMAIFSTSQPPAHTSTTHPEKYGMTSEMKHTTRTKEKTIKIYA